MLSKDKTVRHPAGAAFAIRTGLQTIFLELPVKRLYTRAVVPDQAHFAREEGKPLMDFAELAGTCLREREDELAYVTDLAKLRQHLLHRGFVKFAGERGQNQGHRLVLRETLELLLQCLGLGFTQTMKRSDQPALIEV